MAAYEQRAPDPAHKWGYSCLREDDSGSTVYISHVPLVRVKGPLFHGTSLILNGNWGMLELQRAPGQRMPHWGTRPIREGVGCIVFHWETEQHLDGSEIRSHAGDAHVEADEEEQAHDWPYDCLGRYAEVVRNRLDWNFRKGATPSCLVNESRAARNVNHRVQHKLRHICGLALACHAGQKVKHKWIRPEGSPKASMHRMGILCSSLKAFHTSQS